MALKVENYILTSTINRILNGRCFLNSGQEKFLNRWVPTWEIQRELKLEEELDLSLLEVRKACDKIAAKGGLERKKPKSENYVSYAPNKWAGCEARGNYFVLTA